MMLLNEKKISVVTGSRAEYGILKNLIKKLDNDNNIDFSLIVTGSHLSSEYGLTYKEIKEDKLKLERSAV